MMDVDFNYRKIYLIGIDFNSNVNKTNSITFGRVELKNNATLNQTVPPLKKTRVTLNPLEGAAKKGRTRLSFIEIHPF